MSRCSLQIWLNQLTEFVKSSQVSRGVKGFFLTLATASVLRDWCAEYLLPLLKKPLAVAGRVLFADLPNILSAQGDRELLSIAEFRPIWFIVAGRVAALVVGRTLAGLGCCLALDEAAQAAILACSCWVGLAGAGGALEVVYASMRDWPVKMVGWSLKLNTATGTDPASPASLNTIRSVPPVSDLIANTWSPLAMVSSLSLLAVYAVLAMQLRGVAPNGSISEGSTTGDGGCQ